LRISYQTLTPEDKKLIRKAFDVSVEAHKEQRRKSGKPIYFTLLLAKIVLRSLVPLLLPQHYYMMEDTHLPLKTLNGFLTKSGATCRRIN
jgi:(p)ppGpp synthase/HD superfamily hydrolase